MGSGYSLTGIGLFVLFVILDGALFGFAAATAGANVGELTKKSEEGNKKAAKILAVMDNSIRLNYTIQISAMIMNVVVGAFVLNAVSHYFGEELYIQLITAVALMIIVAVFGIVIPVKVAVLRADKMVESLYSVVSIVLALLSPIIFIVACIGNGILRIFGMNPHADSDNVTEEEILTMVNEGHEQGVIEADEAEMISNIFEFGDKEAVDIMTHRSNIIAVDGDSTLEEAVSFMLHENNSRYPVYDGDIDNIVGIVHIRDALKEYGNRAKAEEPIKNVKEVLYEPKLIPGTRNINDLFKLMQQEKVHMAIVVDEYGQTDGLVTMEDILEEIVGNILDEHDEDEEQIMLKSDNTYIVDGMALLEDLEEELDIEFGVENINTLNGFLILKIGKIPNQDHVGTEIQYEGYTFKILEVEGRIFQSVSITKNELPDVTEETLSVSREEE